LGLNPIAEHIIEDEFSEATEIIPAGVNEGAFQYNPEQQAISN